MRNAQCEMRNANIEIIPVILAKDERTVKRRLTLMEPLVRLVQIDVMDGTLVPQTSWFDAEKIAGWKKNLKYELHLMVNDPVDVMNRWLKVRGLKRVIFHAETPQKLGHLIAAAKRHKLETGIAISPGTPIRKIEPFMKRMDMVLVMGGKPGKSGQRLDRKTLETVRSLRRQYPKLPIGFDMGVNERTIPDLVRAGVTRLCAASAIFGSRSPSRALAALRNIAERQA
jgi:ribulose-phosphate 3-epimerase